MSAGNSRHESYRTLVRIVNDKEDGDYTIHNFNKDAQDIIREENSLQHIVHAKLYLCALMANPPTNYNVELALERIEEVNSENIDSHSETVLQLLR